MNIRSFLFALTACALLTACGSGSGWTPPVYSGKQESTDGVPGFDNGQKRSPYVKLGQSYKVMGEWYVPRFQPDYNETGLASWYGPGFHGGKTANGEKFDKHSMTAAHKTLPLPSIVKVTMVDTGKTVYVRINDRGPFSKGRIIDLSYAAAKEIGLMQKGVAKVRVEYQLAESQRYADLLAQGREPEDIDIAGEVLPYANNSVQVAESEIKEKVARAPTDPKWWEEVNPVGTARAAAPAPLKPLYSDTPANAAPTQNVAMRDLPPATLPEPTAAPLSVSAPIAEPSVFQVMQQGGTSPPSAPQARVADPPPVTAPVNAMYVQVGTFSVKENAMALTKRVMDIGPAKMNVLARGDATLYRVQLGPYDNPEMAEDVLQRVRLMGLSDARAVRLH